MTNQEISQKLRRLHTLLVLGKRSNNLALAIRRALDNIAAWKINVSDMVAKTPVKQLFAGYGPKFIKIFDELIHTGDIALIHQLQPEFDPFFCYLCEIPGIGETMARRMFFDRSIHSMDDLRIAYTNNVLQRIPAFGDARLQAIENVLWSSQQQPSANVVWHDDTENDTDFGSESPSPLEQPLFHESSESSNVQAPESSDLSEQPLFPDPFQSLDKPLFPDPFQPPEHLLFPDPEASLQANHSSQRSLFSGDNHWMNHSDNIADQRIAPESSMEDDNRVPDIQDDDDDTLPPTDDEDTSSPEFPLFEHWNEHMDAALSESDANAEPVTKPHDSDDTSEHGNAETPDSMAPIHAKHINARVLQARVIHANFIQARLIQTSQIISGDPIGLSDEAEIILAEEFRRTDVYADSIQADVVMAEIIYVSSMDVRHIRMNKQFCSHNI